MYVCMYVCMYVYNITNMCVQESRGDQAMCVCVYRYIMHVRVQESRGDRYRYIFLIHVCVQESRGDQGVKRAAEMPVQHRCLLHRAFVEPS